MEPLYLSLVRTFKIYSDERRPCSLQIVMKMVAFSRERYFSSISLGFFFLLIWDIFCSFQLVKISCLTWELCITYEMTKHVGQNRLKNGHSESIVRISISFIANFSSPGSTKEKFCSVSQFPRLNFSCSIALTVPFQPNLLQG